jgi:hypothetical protein
MKKSCQKKAHLQTGLVSNEGKLSEEGLGRATLTIDAMTIITPICLSFLRKRLGEGAKVA